MKKDKCVAILLAAGSGTRMQSKKQKLFLELDGKPVLYYPLKTFDELPWLDEIILVTAAEEMDYCKREVVDKYQFEKVTTIIEGGKERYDSVYCGLQGIEDCDYVFIHDAARALISREVLDDIYESVKVHKACVPAVPVKDTIKIIDEDGFVRTTPARETLRSIQTPQTFSYSYIKEAYDKFMMRKDARITDDAMVAEKYMGALVKVVEGSYENIKLTTPEDMEVAESLIRNRKKV